MNNDSWVCFDCRESYRRAIGYDKEVNCVKCSGSCQNIGHQVHIPKKSDSKSWKRLRDLVIKIKQTSAELSAKEAVRIKHDIEQGERRLDILNQARTREEGMRKLRKQLKKRELSHGK